MRPLKPRCSMCLRPLAITRPRTGRLPTYCPECSKRRKVESSRLGMARLRARRRQAT